MTDGILDTGLIGAAKFIGLKITGNILSDKYAVNKVKFVSKYGDVSRIFNNFKPQVLQDGNGKM